MKTYTTEDIFTVIDKEIKKQMHLKNEYIAKNGLKHTDVIRAFDNKVSALSGLYSAFKN